MEKGKKVLRTKHQVVCGEKNGCHLEGVFRAGEAFLHEGDDYYVLKLAAFPFAYYLRKNKNSDANYTVFARCRDSHDGVRLQDPVGRASLVQELKSHLEIHIPILRLNLFMNLYPVQVGD
jgi:hypothetical protein